MPVLTSNWRFACKQQRVHTRCIVIPFIEHSDEPAETKFQHQFSPGVDNLHTLTCTLQNNNDSVHAGTSSLRLVESFLLSMDTI